MADRQIPVPEPVQQELREYFRDTLYIGQVVRCVVTENEEYGWHHLNHNHRFNRLSNIVPLTDKLNTNLYQAFTRGSECLDARLDCQALKVQAAKAFWSYGQVSRAYGCTRIEYYVAQYCKKPLSYELDCARRALYYARHRLNYVIIEELISDTILKPLERADGKICPAVIMDLLQEFEALLTLGGERADALRLHEHTRSMTAREGRVGHEDAFKHAGALRRFAQTRGMSCGPTPEVLRQLDESTEINCGDANQVLSVVHSKASLHIGEDSKADYKRAMDVVSDAYKTLLAPKISVEAGRVRQRSKSLTLPIRATPSNIADLSLMQAVALAVNKPRRWETVLPDTISVARHYWNVAGAKLERVPGRGSWKRAIGTFNNTPDSAALTRLIASLQAPPLPSSLKAKLLKAANCLAAK